MELALLNIFKAKIDFFNLEKSRDMGIRHESNNSCNLIEAQNSWQSVEGFILLLFLPPLHKDYTIH